MSSFPAISRSRSESGHDNDTTQSNFHSIPSMNHADDTFMHARPSSPVKNKLYISHFLSTWNSRVFEFGSVLFLSTIFPGTLLPASVYALSRAASVIIFSGGVGSFIDHGERMKVVRISIIGQRLATAVSCVLLWLMTSTYAMPRWAAITSLTALSLLACVEKINSVINTISIERDWVVVVAQGNEDDLQKLNSQMRRIDLFCKLVGPLTIALVDGISTRIAIAVTFAMTCVSVGVEYAAIAKVYKGVKDLQKPPTPLTSPTEPITTNNPVLALIIHHCSTALDNLTLYATHPSFLPSLSLSLLYLTVFSFGGQLITYLLSLHLTSPTIGALRTLSTIFELSATWLAPKVMTRIGPIRAGIWFLNWQIAMVGLAAGMLWLDDSTFATVGLLTGVILSRVGLWGFDLSAQIIVQESVHQTHRGAFSALEASVQNTFELLSFASTIAFAKPAHFRYPAAISVCAVVVAGVLYATFVRKRRGHLFHASKCIKRRGGRARGVRGEEDDGYRGGWVELRQVEDGEGEGEGGLGEGGEERK